MALSSFRTAALLGAVTVLSAPSASAFERTEEREPCSSYDPYRQPFFGTTHLHTGLSFDASIRFVDYRSGNDPAGAYRFAKGESSIQLPDPSGLQLPLPLRNPTIDRPLDWGGVTDHSEHFGEMGICKNVLGKDLADLPERLSMECRMLNGFFYSPGRAINPPFGREIASDAFTNLTVVSDGAISKNTRLPVCENNPELCALTELEVWAEHQRAAEDAYDRTGDCTFTSFIAYENTSTPLGVNWHRNVFFRNDRVVRTPVTAIDMAVRVNDSPTSGGPEGVGVPVNTLGTVVPAEPRVFPVLPGTVVTYPLPQPFWNALEEECTLGTNITDGIGTRCDFITIPHNTNLGGGNELIPPLFLDPFNAEDARRHAKFEPLVEIYQDKGSSECRYDPRYNSGTDTVDEFCAFEILDTDSLTAASGVGGSTSDAQLTPQDFNPRAYVRNVWKDGLKAAQAGTWDGVNPFKMGVVAASDSHTGVMGWHPENENWPGHLGIDDAWPMERSSTIQNGTGGHSVVWAEENSRDAIFEALKRKETYGTSGTRPVVRFFGGWDFGPDACSRNFVAEGYEKGVPMGGDLPPRPDTLGQSAGGVAEKSKWGWRRRQNPGPRFVAAAWKDDFIGTNLQQIQIIKLSSSRDGNRSFEKVYTVAGDAGDPLDPETGIHKVNCATKRGGSERLCAVWEDPQFDPQQNAMYYVRVLEEPVCRYSTHWCRKRIGVDPLNLDKCRQDLDALARSDNLEDRLKAERGAACCNNQTTTTFIQPVIQERAWTSPIWYEPEL